MNLKSLTCVVSFLFLVLSSLTLNGQDRLFLENCAQTSPPQAAGITLCEENVEFVPDFIIGQNSSSVTFVSTLNNTVNLFGLNSYFSKSIEVNGRLILDAPLGFFACVLKMRPNAEIITLGQNRLFAQASSFFACGNMWRGITGQQGGIVLLNNCRIEDAINAISAEESTKLSLAGNTFNRNIVGLRNTNGAPGTGALFIDYFNNNTFTSTSSLNNGRAQGYAGIELNNCVADIGAFNWPNTFNGLEYGIHAEASVVSVMSGTFTNMVIGDDGGGVGIYLKDGTLSVQGVYVPPLDEIRGQSSFEGCPEAGILVEGANLYCKYNSFQSNTIGVFSYDNFYAEEIDISFNNFDLDLVNTIGVGVYRSIASGSAAHNTISDNTFDFDQGSLGIFVTGEFPALDLMLIENNHFTVSELFMDENLNCISVNAGNADNYLIRENEIYFDCIFGIKKGRYGIRMRNADGFDHEISFNTPITGVTDDFSARAAIYLDEAKNVTLCSNDSDWTEEGLKIEGDCDNATISTNSFGHHKYGLLVGVPEGNVGGITGVQDRKGNTWLAEYEYPEWAAYHNGSQEEVFASRFLVESTDPSILPSQRFPGNDEWFIFVGGEKNYCSETGPNPAPFSPKETGILQGASPTQLGTTAAGLWDMSRHLSLKGRLQPSISATSISPFFSELNSASYAKAAAVDHEFRLLVELTSSFESGLNETRASQLQVLETLMALNSERAEAGQLENINETFLSTKLAHLQTLQMEVQNEAQIQQNLQQQYQLALNAISALPIMSDQTSSMNIHEDAYRQLQSFKVKRLLGTNTPADLAAILTLAEQDPSTHGLAPLGAQIYLPICNPSTGISFSALQTSGEFDDETTEEHEAPLSLAISPNPAAYATKVSFNHAVSGTVRLWGLQGQLLLEQRLTKQYVIDLDISTLIPGVYIIQYLGEDEKSYSKKLIVK